MTRSSRSSNSASHQAGVLSVGKVLASLSEIVAPLIIVRLIGKADVGVLTALMLIYTTLSMICTLGLPGTLSFHLPTRSDGERRAIARRMGLILLGMGGVAVLVQLAIAGLSAADILETEVKLHYLAALVGLPLGDIPMRMLPNLLVIEDRDRSAAVTSIIRSIGMSLGTLIPLALGASVWTVMLVLSGVGVLFGLTTIAYFLYAYRGIKPGRTDLSIRSMMGFSLPIGLTELVSNLNNRFDRFLIIPLGAIAYAEYTAGSWQIPIIPSITYAVGVAYGPHFAELFKKSRLREAVEVWREQGTKTALLVVPISVVFIVAAEETITLFFTADYINGASVLRFYAIATMGRITAFGTPLIAAGKPKYVLRAALITFMSNVVISVPLVMWIGFNGPALGTALAFIPMVCGYSWYIGKATGVPFREVFPFVNWLKVVAASAPGAALALLFKFSVGVSAAIGLAVEGMIVLLAFALIGSLTGLISREDWRFVGDYALMKALRKSRKSSTSPE